MVTHFNYPIKHRHSFGMDVNALKWIEYSSPNELKQILADSSNFNIFPIGAGSNLLFTEDLFKGTLIHSSIDTIQIVEEDDQRIILKVGSGVNWDAFVQYTVDHHWGGVENLSHIPGEVGSSAVQNIGAYGVEAKDAIIAVEYIDRRTGEELTLSVHECEYAYRSSIFKKQLKDRCIITYVHYCLSKHPVLNLTYGPLAQLAEKNPELNIHKLREAIIQIREEKLPDWKKLGNAGSFFMNPVISREQFELIKVNYPLIPSYPAPEQQIKIPAAWLIEQSGWKGKALGNAYVYEKQPLVLVNSGEATSQEIVALATAIINAVKEKFNIELHPEVIYVK